MTRAWWSIKKRVTRSGVRVLSWRATQTHFISSYNSSSPDDDKGLVVDQKRVTRSYVRGWFFIDLVT
jgi:hypothetical protein